MLLINRMVVMKAGDVQSGTNKYAESSLSLLLKSLTLEMIIDTTSAIAEEDRAMYSIS